MINDIAYVGLISNSNQIYKYHPDQDFWEPVLSISRVIPSRRNTVFVIDNIAYIHIANESSNNFYSYNPVSNRLNSLADLPIDTDDAVGLSLNGKGYIVTGRNNSGYYKYDPIENLWTHACMDIDLIAEAVGWTEGNSIAIFSGNSDNVDYANIIPTKTMFKLVPK